VLLRHAVRPACIAALGSSTIAVVSTGIRNALGAPRKHELRPTRAVAFSAFRRVLADPEESGPGDLIIRR